MSAIVPATRVSDQIQFVSIQCSDQVGSILRNEFMYCIVLDLLINQSNALQR